MNADIPVVSLLCDEIYSSKAQNVNSTNNNLDLWHNYLIFKGKQRHYGIQGVCQLWIVLGLWLFFLWQRVQKHRKEKKTKFGEKRNYTIHYSLFTISNFTIKSQTVFVPYQYYKQMIIH